MSRGQRSRKTWSRSRKRMHDHKIPWTEYGAKRAADRRVAEGAYRESINTYPCPFSDPDRPHWHVGTRTSEHGRRRR